MENCIFCKIANKEIPAYIIYEDENYMAFLSIAKEVEGATVLIPKKHYTSYFAEVETQVLCDLMERAKKVARLLDSKLKNVKRTILSIEGFEVDHLHIKLWPAFEGDRKGNRARDIEDVYRQITLDC